MKKKKTTRRRNERPRAPHEPRKLLTLLNLEVLVGVVGIIVALFMWRATDPLSWERFWNRLLRSELFVDEENRFFFKNYDRWWSSGSISPPNQLFQDEGSTEAGEVLQVLIFNQIHEYTVDKDLDERYVPDADLEYLMLNLDDSRGYSWWAPGASVYLIIQIAPGMTVNQHGMDEALRSYFRETGNYELLNEGHTTSPPSKMENPSIPHPSFYELSRVRDQGDVAVHFPRFRMVPEDSSDLTSIPQDFVPTEYLPMISDGNDREGAELRVCMAMFYRDRTFFALSLYATPSVYEAAVEKVLRPIFESWTFF